mgnify:CR=1 FL=1
MNKNKYNLYDKAFCLLSKSCKYVNTKRNKAIPVINNLVEPKKLIELITGVTDDMSDEELVDWTETINTTGEGVRSPAELEAAEKRVFNTKQENLPGKKITIDDIRKGKSDLHYGDQGPSVKQIQKMLLKLDLDLGEKGADSFYGTDTKDAVEYFQMNLDSYGIEDAIMLDEIDGIVGDETLKAIEKAIKNKDNG